MISQDMSSRKRNSRKILRRESRRNFLKGLGAVPAGPLLRAGTDTLPASTSSKAAPEVFGSFSERRVPDEPFEWIIPKRYSLYMRHEDDYVRNFINDKLGPPRGFGKVSGVKLNGRPYAPTSGSIVFQGVKNKVELQLD